MAIQPLTRPTLSKRRVKYATDETYRENAKDLSRKAYRKTADVDLQSCLYSLQFIDRLEEHIVKLPNGKTKLMRAASVPKTAQMLQMLYQTFWRWISNGVIPKPVLVSTGARNFPMYHVEEMRVLIEEIGEHQKEINYLRRDHTAVRKRIEQRFVDVRKTLKIN